MRTVYTSRLDTYYSNTIFFLTENSLVIINFVTEKNMEVSKK